MNNKIQLLSSRKPSGMEKAAIPSFMTSGLKEVMPALSNLAARRDFIGGLLAPIPKLVGGVQKITGLGQQGVAALSAGSKNTLKDLANDPLFLEGRKNFLTGNRMRRQSRFRNLFTDKNPASYRAGRALGGATIGATILGIPYSATQYLGASSADPEAVKEYAKNMAYLRMEDRMNEFAGMPFMDRLQTTLNPGKYTESLNTPEANDLIENIKNKNINNPGILKYLSSFNPFVGTLLGNNAEDLISQNVRSQMLKGARLKQAGLPTGNFFKNVLQPAYNYGKKVRLRSKGIRDESLKGLKKPNYETMDLPWWQSMSGRLATQAGKDPLSAGLGALGIGYIPYDMYSSYQGGKQNVFDAAKLNAEAMADLGLMEKFNTPGFMGGLGRLGMALAPGLGSDMALKQIRRSMFPESYISE